jgi:hypothetical protein
VTRITAHSLDYCFAVTAPSDDGGAVLHLGPLNWRPSFFTGVRSPLLGWRSHELLPKDIKQQHNDAEEDEKADYQYRSVGLRLSLLLTFSCRCRV